MVIARPVSRMCRYPVLFRHLLKYYPRDHAFYQELEDGVAACGRIVDKCAEAQRRARNAATVKLLEQRVEDWKGHDLANFGELVRSDNLGVKRSGGHHNYQVFLFEKIILFCKEVVNFPPWDPRSGKFGSIWKKPGPSLSPHTPVTDSSKEMGPLRLKGRVFVRSVTHTVCKTEGGECYAKHSVPILWSRNSWSLRENP